MKWEAISSTPEHETYHLYKGDQKLLQLVFSPFTYSLRIECNGIKRVFFIRREGFLRNRVVIRNEYGIKTGEFGLENKAHFISFDEDRFYYTNDHSTITLSKEAEGEPHLSCKIPANNTGQSSRFKNDKELGNVHPALLMTLCWYSFQPAEKEKAAELALS